MPTRAWFPTLVYDAALAKDGARRLRAELLEECLRIREIDDDGRRWCADRYPGGYTSYGTLTKLHRTSSTFAELRSRIDRHVRAFARSLQFDLDGRALEMTDCWVNVMPPGCAHTSHLHPSSTISGTYYVQTPKGASCIKFEDPRLASFMAAPPRRAAPAARNRTFVEYPAEAGRVVLFESWLRHEVPVSRAAAERVGISFNYGWF